MGQQLIGRPISARPGFSTLDTASSPFAGNLAQFRGYHTPMQPAFNTPRIVRPLPGVLGFRNFRNPEYLPRGLMTGRSRGFSDY